MVNQDKFQYLMCLYLAVCSSLVRSFQPSLSQQRTNAASTRSHQVNQMHPSASGVSQLSMTKPSRAAPPSKGDFEYEELRAQMKAMRKAKLVAADLTPEKRKELEGYLEGILSKRPSPVPMKSIGDNLSDTKWRLSFSTEGFASAGLPRDSTIVMEFMDDKTATYALEFGDKTFGLKNLKATCTWTCGTNDSAMDPSRSGVLTLQYDKITTDAFGFSNIGVGMFGMLQGRSNYVQSVYFDGTVWIEEGSGPEGQQYFNVYTKETNS